jgi:hypothetical protein
VERQFFEPFAQQQDFDSRFFLSAIKIEYELQGLVGSQFLGIVPEAGAGVVVGGFRELPCGPPLYSTRYGLHY